MFLKSRQYSMTARLTGAIASAVTAAVLGAATPATWSASGSLNAPVTGHIQVALRDGRVLIAGGLSNGIEVGKTEIYDPKTGAWSVTGSLQTARTQASAVLLPSGKVLIAGGTAAGNVVLSSAELYDPLTGLWTLTGAMKTARTEFSATTIETGKVLAAGGCPTATCTYTTALTSSELYNPATGAWLTTGSLTTGRFGHTAVTLQSRKVMVTPLTGTNLLGDPEVYDPIAGAWSPTGGMSYQYPIYATAAVLMNGEVLMLGGYPRTGNAIGTEVYNPATNTWSIGPNLLHLHQNYTATTLTTGKVLIAGGGYTTSSSCSGRGGCHTTVTPDLTSEIYDPTTNTFALTGPMTGIRSGARATLLSNEAVLVSGGSTSVTETEVYNPANIIHISSASFNFGGQLVLHSGTAYPVTLTNLTIPAMGITKIATTGDFSETNNCAPTLLHSQSCTVEVTFDPTVAGSRTGALNLTFSNEPFAASVSLSGTGLTHQLVASPAGVSLSAVSGTSTSTTVTIKNVAPGVAPVDLTLTGAGFTSTTNCGATLASGLSCSVAIKFAPTTAATYNGALTVASSVGTQTITLVGSGTAVALSVTPATLAFGPMAVGDGTNLAVTVSNATAIPFNITGVTLSGADFSVNSTTCSTTLAAGASCSVTIQFAPTDYVTYGGTLTITDNHGGKHVVTISGTGVAPS